MSIATLRRSGAASNPKSAAPRGQTAQRQAFLSAVRLLEQVESPGAMQVVTRAVSEVLAPTQSAPTRAKVAKEQVAKEQEAQLEWKALQRAFEFRRALLKDAITTTQVAQLLGISRQAVGERERKGQLLGVMEGGQLRFPLWQFDPSGSGGIIEGLPSVLRALDEGRAIPPLAKMSWLRKANPALGDASPLESLRSGRWAEVQAAARGALAI